LIGIIVVMALDASIQFAGAVGTIKQYRAQRAVADYLRDHFDSNSNARIFCDEGTVRVLSGIPENRFVTSSSLASGGSTGSDTDQLRSRQETFTTLLQASRVEYLVVADVQGSILARRQHGDEAPQVDTFKTVLRSRTSFLPTDIWLLRTNSWPPH
jgi:hypothetical protein